MEVEQLRQFLKIAELNNFTAAAAEVGLSQSALSRSIARLEEELGRPVLERQTRRVILTDAGQVLFEKAKQILALIDDVKSEIVDDGTTGRVRLGVIPTIAPYLLPPILKSFSKKFPQSIVTLREDTTDNLLKSIQQGDLDLLVMAWPLTVKHLDAEILFEESLLVVLAADHPLAKKKRLKPAEIEHLPFVMLGETHCLSDNILSFCRKRSIHPVSVERTNQLTTVQELVALNHGISMIPTMACQMDHSRKRVYREMAESAPTRRIITVWNPYRFQSKLMQSFKLHLKHETEHLKS